MIRPWIGLWIFVTHFLCHQNIYTHAQYLQRSKHPPKDNYPQAQYPSARQNIYRGPVAKKHPCEQGSCYPQTGNLIIGREDQLYASSTCGLKRQEKYCIVSHLDDERKKCFWCDSRPSNRQFSLNHNITNIVYKYHPGTKTKTWWQSENGKENVYIQLDFEAEFHFTHLLLTFQTFRPAAMIIERSYDHKQTWQVYRYFADNCKETFPHVKEGPPEKITDVICESRYSKISPATDGELVFRVLYPGIAIPNPYATEVQNLLKMTNLRINFTKLHTLGDDLLDQRSEIQEKYYYAISEMVVRGSCSCYGHANRCLPLNPELPNSQDMVHGKCECTHNTRGKNCEMCEPFFNDFPWRPAIGVNANACQRCNCNNHATTCHFDPARWAETGNVTGGICDDCQHHTMGANCEQCEPYYYRDPNVDLQDPEACKHCDCDNRGSLEDGVCDSITDPVNKLVAGTCHCKENVEGRRCDRCKNGFWNFSAANPEGCQPCTCNTLGTVDNQGCNVYTGECTCKRYVTGRDCMQCLPQFWGLSDQQDGCQPCNCDYGGSYDNFCDVINGQCRCRVHMTGRQCDVPDQSHFIAQLDFFVFEAEGSKTNGQVYIREPWRDGKNMTWSGTGFVNVIDGNFIEFIINDIVTTMDYDLIIRYEPRTQDSWEDVRVTLERSGPVDPNGKCAYVIQHDGDRVRHAQLSAYQREEIVVPPLCLEAGQTYIIRLDFSMTPNYATPRSTTPSVLIDSIVLRPRLDEVPAFSSTIEDEYIRNNCKNPAYMLPGADVPEICIKYYSSVAAYVFGGAKPCNCDPTGSTSKICHPQGGHCNCKPNVVGRTCDQCAPGTYGFGPEGCKACDCDSIGASDNFCNAGTGQCKCRSNNYGRQCNQCRTGFWRFPNCERCECNGHADICESRTGVCIECRNNTQGDHCETCVEGFYGDPRINEDIPCRPCPCPGLIGSNHSFADTCSLDLNTKDVSCDCQQGYAGPRCDVCADNYWGNPEVPGGICQPCGCNDKINLDLPGNCDPHTGKCLRCLEDTTGDHCEVCKSGYFRYTEFDRCQECVCNPLGTNFTAGSCNPNNGQCHCFPNVTGQECDQCLPNHWKIASGTGCEACDCDPVGSERPQCNEFDGQCSCREGFGGRQCNECMPEFYGNPKEDRCLPCECDSHGSRNKQCDMRTGACNCLPGVGGHKCDQCERGFIGYVPQCDSCGECFVNWDRILQESKNQTLQITERAGDIKQVGATGAYTKEFEDMQAQLDEIDKLLNNTVEVDVDDIEQKLQNLRQQLNETETDKITTLDNSLATIKESLYLTERNVHDYNASIADIKRKIAEHENNGTKLQEANVQGALALIKNAKEKADLAAHRAERSQEDVKYAENQCRATEKFINQTKEFYEKQSDDNEKELKNIRDQLQKLNQEIPNLNDLVCDGSGDPCDAICGGAGCNSCGNSLSCENGAKQQAETAMNFANRTEIALKEKESMVNDFIRNVSQINTDEIRDLAQETYDIVNNELQKSNLSLTIANDLKKDMREHMSQNHTKPEEIKKLAEEVLSKQVHKTPEEVRELADKIKDAVDRLTNTDYIIEATRNDLAKVNELKQNAETAKSTATKLLGEAEDVNKSLNKTQHAQKEVEDATEKVLNDYKEVERILKEISNKTDAAQGTTSKIDTQLVDIKLKLTDLQKNLTDSDLFAKRIIAESENTLQNAKKASNEAADLQYKYGEAKSQLDNRLGEVRNKKDKSKELSDKALELVAKITKTQEDILRIEESNDQDENLTKLENQLISLINSMTGYTKKLQDREQYYKTCS